MSVATALASSNIAFIKYWGNLVPDLRLPFNDSVSMNLSDATTTTTVRFDEAYEVDEVVLNSLTLEGEQLVRVAEHLDRLRRLAGSDVRAHVTSTNSFPTGTGIASSASGFAALTVAGAAAAGLTMSEEALSALARRGSGSAARSVPSGFVAWRAAHSSAGSYAWSIAPPEHWDLRDIVAIVSRAHKAVGSGGGHDAAMTSPHFPARLRALPAKLEAVTQAIHDRDIHALGTVVEAEALDLHAMAMTSQPPILYWTDATVALLHQVARWRSQGLAVYFTLDAGPNVHLICDAESAGPITHALDGLSYVESYLHNRPAGAARLVSDSELTHVGKGAR